MNKSNSTRSKGGVFLYFYSYYLAIKLIRNWLKSRSIQIMKTSKASSESQPQYMIASSTKIQAFSNV